MWRGKDNLCFVASWCLCLGLGLCLCVCVRVCVCVCVCVCGPCRPGTTACSLATFIARLFCGPFSRPMCLASFLARLFCDPFSRPCVWPHLLRQSCNGVATVSAHLLRLFCFGVATVWWHLLRLSCFLASQRFGNISRACLVCTPWRHAERDFICRNYFRTCRRSVSVWCDAISMSQCDVVVISVPQIKEYFIMEHSWLHVCHGMQRALAKK